MKSKLIAIASAATVLTMGLSACGSSSSGGSSDSSSGGGTVASQMIFGGPPEFKTRADGIPGIEKNYGVTFGKYTVTDTGGPVTVNALKRGQVDAVDLFTTDPAIEANDFVILEDPKSNFAAQNIVPIINKDKASDGVKQVLNGVSAKLTTDGLGDPDRRGRQRQEGPGRRGQGLAVGERPGHHRQLGQGREHHRRLGQLPRERHPGQHLRRGARRPRARRSRPSSTSAAGRSTTRRSKSGSLDLFPEYTGTILTYLDDKSTATSPDDVYAALGKVLPSNLVALDHGRGPGQRRGRGHQGDRREVQAEDDRRPGQEGLTQPSSQDRRHLRTRTGNHVRCASVVLESRGMAHHHRSGGDAVPPTNKTLLWIAGVLLMIPIVALIWVQPYARDTPELGGVPFFFWYQFLWVFVCAACTYTAHRLVLAARKPRSRDGQVGR